MKEYFIHNGTVLAALILCGLCLSLPVYQWVSIPSGFLLQCLGGAAALALGICKLTFIPLAIENFRQKSHIPAFFLFAVAMVALAVSVSASRDLLNNATTIKQQSGAVNSLAYQNAVTELNDLNGEIKTLNALLAADLAAGYRERAYLQREKLETLKMQRAAIASKAERLAQSSPAHTGATFGRNIKLSLGGVEAGLQAATGAAIALHLACIFSVLAVTSWKPEPQGAERFKSNEGRQENVKKMPVKKVDKPKPAPAGGNDLTPAQHELASRITAGEFGSKPAMRELIANKAIKGGFNKVRPVFDYLIRQNKLIETGKGFELVQKTI